MYDQQIKCWKRKSSSTSDLPIAKKAKHGMDAIEERRKLREAQTKSLAYQKKKQLVDIQQKTEKINAAIEKGIVIQTESDVDNSNQKPSTKTTRKECTKENGYPSCAKSLGTSQESLLPPSPLKTKGKNIIHEDIFPEPKDDLRRF